MVPAVASARPDRRWRVDGRLAGGIGFAAGFAGDLILAAGFSVWHPNHALGGLLLSLVATALGWYTTIPAAVGLGVLGWLFYAGFVTHTDGQLGFGGTGDLVVVTVLTGCAVAAAAIHRLVRST